MPVLGEPVQIERAAVNGRGVDLEIRAVDHRTHRRLNRQRRRINRRVRDVDELRLETPKRDLRPGLDPMDGGLFGQFVFAEAAFDQRLGKARCVDRRVELRKDVRDRTNVVLVTVREHQPSQLVLVVEQIGDVGDDDVDAQQFPARKHHACVDDDDVIPATQSEHVHPELAEPTERDDLQLVIRQCGETSTQKRIIGLFQASGAGNDLPETACSLARLLDDRCLRRPQPAITNSSSRQPPNSARL